MHQYSQHLESKVSCTNKYDIILEKMRVLNILIWMNYRETGYRFLQGSVRIIVLSCNYKSNATDICSDGCFVQRKPNKSTLNMCVVVVGLHTRNEVNQPYVLSVHRTSLCFLCFLWKLSPPFFLVNLKTWIYFDFVTLPLSCFYCAM